MGALNTVSGWLDDRVRSGLLWAPAGPVSALPTAPNDGQSRTYLDPGHRLMRYAPSALGVGLSLGLLAFSWNRPWMLLVVPWLLVATVHWLLTGWLMTGHREFDLDAHDAAAAAHPSGPPPSVDIFLPNCGEPLAILENAFAHVAKLRHDGPLRVLCLDDAGREEVAELARRWGFEYLTRPAPRAYATAGNLRYGYEHSDGDFIVVFDADFCPRPDFLTQLLPYAVDDPSVGIVQSPQYFLQGRSQNWLQNGSANLQDPFYRLVMPSRDGRDCAICVGTNALYRRSALQAIGGTVLVDCAEDVHTGFDLTCVGYRTKYVPVVLAQGVCPDSFTGLVSQQYRWCKGSVRLGVSRKLWRAPLSIRARAIFLTGLTYYLYSGLGVLLLPLAVVIMAWIYPADLGGWSALLLVPIVYQLMALIGLGPSEAARVSGLRAARLSSWSHLNALYDLVRRHTPVSTAAGAAGGRGPSRGDRLRLVTVVWGVASGAGIIAGAVVHMPHPQTVSLWPVIGFGILNLVISLGLLVPLRTPARGR